MQTDRPIYDHSFLNELKSFALSAQPGELEKILSYKTIYQRFLESARNKKKPALKYFGTQISFSELIEKVDIVAKGLSEIGIKNNDIVAVSLLPTPSAIILFYALDKIGAVQHMINCTSGIDEIKRELNHIPSSFFIANDLFCTEAVRGAVKESGIQKIVTTSLLDYMGTISITDKLKYILAEKAKGLKKKDYISNDMIPFSELLQVGKKSNKEVDACQYVKDKIVTIAYTSGSTGNSKACAATWDGIDAMIHVMAMTEMGRFEAEDVMLSTFPLWIYYSLINMIHEPLCLGVCLALDPLFNPQNIAKRNKQYKFNHWLTIPPYVNSMVDANKKTDCSKWKIVLTGGDALTLETKRRGEEYIRKNGGNVSIGQGYGASEVLGSFAYTYYIDATEGSVGIPCVGNRIKILDQDTGKELGINEMGVGYFYTPARMKEYYGDIEATNHNLVMDDAGVTWYNTEDLIHVNEKGEIFLDGRIRRIVLTLDADGNPTKIIPDRVKKAILEIKDIEKCEVITVPDKEKVNVSVAFIVAKNGQGNWVDKNKIMSYLGQNIPEYMMPREIRVIDGIPLTSAKKPDYKKLEEIYSRDGGL